MGLKSDEEIREERKDRKEDPGFFNYGEENEDVGEDEDFQGDDLPSAGHGEVDQHRELREYARLAAWELPMLHKLAQPFEPPDKTTPLRFRYTTYMGEQHPASRKVVLEFSPSELPDLSPLQTAKLIKLAGPRYNPSLNLIKMSCESFETQAQNKRYLGDLVYKLLKTAKDASTDNFEDVPADFRHHKPKPFHVFPERWKLTPERRKVLEEKRVKELQDEEAKRKDGSLVDGASVISEALNRLGMREMLEKREREKLGSGNAAARPGRGRVTGGAGGAKRF
ncbi:hypothetical protein EJ08DRAFT_593660 [Tothia fuscella]|uniref:Small ribosomal subunit protein mS35 mitochondrial conserved domain-containing protein n=1 Tax=Tothia fuscella TaxID=1048955 RepID=A0A9P4TVN1_9PEZI|nr:hypothetical protein EJ08DRAFT_593660 [Tothia fuscella]